MTTLIDSENLDDYVVVPIDELSEEALQGLITAQVTREGTDYGERELAFEAKATELHQKLLLGQLVIVYHIPTEAIELLHKDDVPQTLRPPPSS